MSAPLAFASRPRWYLPVLVVILLLGLLLRVWIWQDQARAGSVGTGDEDEYYRGAIHLLLQGDYYDMGKWLRPPVTSLYLAGAFAVVGVNLPLALLYQSALSLLAVALTATLTRRLFRRGVSPSFPAPFPLGSASATFGSTGEGGARARGSAREGEQRKGGAGSEFRISAVAAAAAAFYLPFAAYGSRLLSETLFIIFLALAMVLLERAQTRLRAGRRAGAALAAAGLALGLAILTRAFLFYFVPLLFLWLWLERRNSGRTLFSFIPLVAGAVLVIAPWTARNYAVYHQLVPVETEGGYSFLIGTEPGQNEAALQSYWLRAYPNSAQRQQAQYAAGIENVRRAPLQWFARMRDKVTGLWHLHVRNLANNGTRGATMQLGSVNFALVSDLQYVLLMLAALLGIALAHREQWFWPLLALPVYTTLVGAATVTSVRIREPLMLALIVYAAPVLANPRAALTRLLQVARGRQAFFVAAAAGFVLLIYSSSYLSFFQGRAWLAAARLGGGEAAIQRAIAADRDSVFPYLALGDAQMARGENEAALASFEKAHAEMPDNTNVQAKLIQLLRERGDEEGARAAAQFIAEAGFDNSQWYEWAWARVPFAAREPMDPGAPAVGVLRGVYGAEQEGHLLFRWTLGHADFRIRSPGATKLSLRLRADESKAVEVWLDGVLIQTLQVTRTWMDFDVVLAQPAPGESLVELRTTTTVPGVDEPYPRGVAVAAVELLRP